MARINLLPWREQLREERKKEFLTVLVLIVLFAGGLVFLGDRTIEMSSCKRKSLFWKRV